jgi:CRP-like cAMP-binding protein
MLDEIKKQIPGFWQNYSYLFKELNVPPKTTLLQEGQKSNNLYFINNGCLRIWFNNKGKDITLQFFFEKQAVSSIESFFTGCPSLFSIETLEQSGLYSVTKKNFDLLFEEIPELSKGFQKILIYRLEHYAKLFLSRIKDSPEERYLDLLKNNPQILQRVPQHYIASYLGITSVSLSRIRNRIK